MAKNIKTLKEAELKNMISEAVKRVLKEGFYDTPDDWFYNQLREKAIEELEYLRNGEQDEDATVLNIVDKAFEMYKEAESARAKSINERNEKSEAVKNTLKEMNNGLLPDGPSNLEEEFEDEFSNTIESYASDFLRKGWKIQDFAKWCHELVDEVIKYM